MKFLATTYPMLPVIASQKGLTNILKRYKVDYHISQKPEKNNPDYISIRFKDCYLIYKDEMRNTLLLNSLYLMNPEEYNFATLMQIFLILDILWIHMARVLVFILEIHFVLTLVL